MPLLTRLLEEIRPNFTIQSEWAEFRNLVRPPAKLADRIKTAVELFPCDLLFVHRDAERDPREARRAEIDAALKELLREGVRVPVVRVVPVRMQEAWLLVDESAIRKAAGNPAGRIDLALPPAHRIEEIPDPKERLFQALRTASGQQGRKLKKLRLPVLRRRVAELIEDLTPLRSIPAFIALEDEIEQFLDQPMNEQRN